LSITVIPTSSNLHQPVLDAIIQSSRRWQQLELGSLRFDSNVWKKIISLSTDDLCMLRELRLHSTRSLEWAEDLWFESGLFAAHGLRSISIGDIHHISVFPTGIPPNWKNLNHLFIHAPISLGLANQLLSHCCNLVACVIVIAMSWDNQGWGQGWDYNQGWDDQRVHNPPIILSSFCLPHLDFLSLQGDPTICSQLFRHIDAQALRILHCNGQFPTTIEASGLFNFLSTIPSLKMLMMDCENIIGDNPLECGTLLPSVTHLVIGPSPKHLYSYSSAFPGPYPQTAELLTALYEIKHQYFPHSPPTVLFPSLEVLEAYYIRTLTDATLLELIIARIDATKSNPETVSKLRKVVVQFSRPREIDIVPEALAYAQAAGIQLELELTYVTGQSFSREWSPSFGLTGKDGTSWKYSSYDACFDM